MLNIKKHYIIILSFMFLLSACIPQPDIQSNDIIIITSKPVSTKSSKSDNAASTGQKDKSPTKTPKKESSSGTKKSNSTYDFSIPTSYDKPASDVLDQVAFAGTGGTEAMKYNCPCGEITSNGIILTEFEPNQLIRIIVYEEKGLVNGEYITEWKVKTDNNGETRINIQGGKDKNYTYLILKSSNGKKIITLPRGVVIMPETDFYACRGNENTRLSVGDSARVTITNGLPVRLRSEPIVTESTYITSIAEGVTMNIMDGPACNSGWVWWKVRTEDNQTGWMAEGDKGDWFIEPWP